MKLLAIAALLPLGVAIGLVAGPTKIVTRANVLTTTETRIVVHTSTRVVTRPRPVRGSVSTRGHSAARSSCKAPSGLNLSSEVRSSGRSRTRAGLAARCCDTSSSTEPCTTRPVGSPTPDLTPERRSRRVVRTPSKLTSRRTFSRDQFVLSLPRRVARRSSSVSPYSMSSNTRTRVTTATYRSNPITVTA